MGTWIDSLKVGCTVLVQRGGGMSSIQRVQIVRETPTQLVLKRGTRIAKKTGYEIGALNRHDRYQLVATTADSLKRLEQAELGRWAQQAPYLLSKLPADKLRQLKLLYDKLVKPDA